MDRRSFIGGLLTLAASRGLFPRAAFAAPTGKPGDSDHIDKENRFTTARLKQQVLEDLGELGRFRLLYLTNSADMKSHLVVLNTARTRIDVAVPLPLTKWHSVVLPPGEKPTHVLAAELDSPKAVVVDIVKGAVTAELSPSRKDHYFSGHGAISRDGATLYLPEFPREEGSAFGVVVAREFPSGKMKATFETGAYRPHNLLLSRDGKKLLVGHYGRSVTEHEPPSDGGIALLELPSGKILPVAAPDDPYLALCHIEAGDGDAVFISTRSWSGKHQLISPVLFGSLSAPRWESRIPPALKERFRFNFSLRLAREAGVLAVAHLEGKMVSFWDVKAQSLLGTVDLGKESPLGVDVTPDGKYFLVNTTLSTLLFIDVKTRAVAKRTSLLGVGYSPHIAVLPV